MKKTLTSNLYYEEDLRYNREICHWRYEILPDGRLYSSGKHRNYPTSITKEDLPEWYVYGRYHKRWGYLNCKDIVDVKYLPFPFPENHLVKDSVMLISYSKPIEPLRNAEESHRCEAYTHDDEVWDNEIITVLKAMRKYGGYNIDPVIEEIWQHIEWLRQYETEYVNETVPNRESFDRWWKD